MKKKNMVIGIVCGLCAFSAIAGACAATAVTQITAELRPDFTIVVDGKECVFKNVNGEVVNPVLYEGTTYLPVRAIGELMGKKVYWYEDQKKIELKDETSTVTDADVIVPGTGNKTNNSSTGGDVKLTDEQARSIALKKAGITNPDTVKFNYIKLDREGARFVYEVKFSTAKEDDASAKKYEVEIDANTGDIIKYEAEPIGSGSSKNSSVLGGIVVNNNGEEITEEQARAIALERAGLSESDVKFDRVKRDVENSHVVFEVEFYTVNANGKKDTEYSADIDIKSGEIIKWEVDKD